MPESNTFAYSPETLHELEMNLKEEKGFENPDDWELRYVSDADETGEDRLVYGFGSVCPLARGSGVDVCKAFKSKHNCCQSVVSEWLARNYLAKHAFESSNHPTHNDKRAAFAAAREARMEEGLETKDDRKAFRSHCDYFMEQKTQAARERESSDRDRGRGSRDDRGRIRMRSRSHRSTAPAARTPAARSKSTDPLGQTAAAVVNDSTVVAHRPSGYAKVSVDELKTLESCLGRAIDSQKRTIESLNFFSRMIEDERKIFTEAKNVITDLIFKASR